MQTSTYMTLADICEQISTDNCSVHTYLKNIYHNVSHLKITSLPSHPYIGGYEDKVEAIILLLKLPSFNSYFKVMLYNQSKLEHIVQRAYAVENGDLSVNSYTKYQEILHYFFTEHMDSLSTVYTVDITHSLEDTEPVLSLFDLAYQIPSLHGIAYLYPEDTEIRLHLLYCYVQDQHKSDYASIRTVNALFINFLKEKLFNPNYTSSVTQMSDILNDLHQYLAYVPTPSPTSTTFTLKTDTTEVKSEIKEPLPDKTPDILCKTISDKKSVASEFDKVQELLRAVMFYNCTIEKIEIHIHS